MSAKLIGTLLGLILSFPAYLALREKKIHQDDLFLRRLRERGQLTASLFNEESDLRVSGTLGEKDGAYVLEVISLRAGQEETLAFAATDKEEIARFLEARTPLRLGDFFL